MIVSQIEFRGLIEFLQFSFACVEFYGYMLILTVIRSWQHCCQQLRCNIKRIPLFNTEHTSSLETKKSTKIFKWWQVK